MKAKNKKILKITSLFFAVLLLSACTANFCSSEDKAHIMYVHESGLEENESGEQVYNKNLQKIVDGAKKEGISTPSMAFWTRVDEETLKLAFNKYKEVKPEETEGMTIDSITDEVKESSLKQFGYYKFLGSKSSNTLGYGTELWGNWKILVHQLGQEIGIENVPDTDFTSFYIKQIDLVANQTRSCIALDDGMYGTVGEEHYVSAKSWGYAWKKGFIEGLLVYPVAALVEVLTKAFGAGGWGQIGAILLTTLIVRGILLLLTLKPTIATQKMSALQPEIAKLQQKYPNADTNKYEKQALAQAQMALYKKNKINPMSTFIVLIIQFPVFIAVWGAMNGSASLSSDAVLGLNLSARLGASMTSNFFSAGWWTAVVLFLLMTAAQFVSSRLQTWLTKARTKKEVVRLGKNPAEEKQKSQSRMMMNIMFIMIIVMSWTLPAAMGVYWLVGAFISIAQTLITNKIIYGKKKKR